MGTQEVITETQIKQRLLDLEEQNRKLQQELLEERKNTNFTQTYPKGWERIRNLIQSNPGAARVVFRPIRTHRWQLVEQL